MTMQQQEGFNYEYPTPEIPVKNGWFRENGAAVGIITIMLLSGVGAVWAYLGYDKARDLEGQVYALQGQVFDPAGNSYVEMIRQGVLPARCLEEQVENGQKVCKQAESVLPILLKKVLENASTTTP